MAASGFKARLNRLFTQVHPAGRGPYRTSEVAAATGLSTSYLGYLRNGTRDNPTMRQIASLARFFGVPPGYFFDDGVAAEASEDDVAVLAALHRPPVRRGAALLPRLSDPALGYVEDLAGMLVAGMLNGLPPGNRGTTGANGARGRHGN